MILSTKIDVKKCSQQINSIKKLFRLKQFFFLHRKYDKAKLLFGWKLSIGVTPAQIKFANTRINFFIFIKIIGLVQKHSHQEFS